MIKLLFILLFNTQDTVTATTYKLIPADNGSYGKQVASGIKINTKSPHSNRIIAVSRDLLRQYPFHSLVLVKGAGKFSGVYKVEDVMNPMWTKRIDILINYKTTQERFDNVTIKHYEAHKSNLKSRKRRHVILHHLPSKRRNKAIKSKHSSRYSKHKTLKRRNN